MRFFFSLVVLLAGISAFSQPVHNSFSGKIVSAANAKPLAGASVYLPDQKRGAVADNNGFFSINGLRNGNYLVEISYQGFASIVENIRFNGQLDTSFSLEPRVVENQAVIVTGVSSAMKIKQTPQPINVVKREDLQRLVSANAIEALSKSVPGVSVLSTGPAIGKPFIRGLGYNRVVTINDGVRQEGQQWGDEHGIEVDDYSIQRIEVLKGPASLLYGSDALAGVINIISQRPVTEGKISGSVGTEYQTNNALRGVYGNIGGTKNGFSWNAYGSYKAAHDFQNKYDGYVYNSKFYQGNFGGMLGYSGKWGYSHILASYFNQHIGMVDGGRDEEGRFLKVLPGGDEAVAVNSDFKSIDPQVPYQHIRHTKITSESMFNLGESQLELVVGLQRNQRQEFGDPDEPKTPEAYFDLKTLTYAARLHLPSQSKYWKFTVGANGMYQTNENRAEETLIPDYNIFDIGAFGFTQYHKDKFSFSGGLRFDNRHINSDAMTVDDELKFIGFTKDFSNVSGSAGITYAVSKPVNLKLNLARGYRAPSLAELASNGAHEGTNRYEIGDRSLKSETSYQVDGGVEWNTMHLSVEANLFYNHVQNFIFYQKLQNSAGTDSLITDPESGEELMAFRFNQHSANLYGTEVSVDIHPHPLDWLHFKNAFSYTVARFTEPVDGSKNIPNVPAGRLFSELAVNLLPEGKTFRNLYVNLQSDYNFAQNHAFTGYNTETNTPSYWLLNAGIGTDIHHRDRKWASLQVSLQNITDEAYQSHLSRLKYTAVNPVTGRQGVFAMGRNLALRLNIPLDFNWN
ncbi:MAG: TonB-dependent receptor [Flavihumibacter sp.]